MSFKLTRFTQFSTFANLNMATYQKIIVKIWKNFLLGGFKYEVQHVLKTA